MFADGKGGFATLSGGWAHSCSNGQITSLHASFSGSGSAGNLAHPFYHLSVALSYPPPSLSLTTSPAPPGGVTTIAVRHLNMSQSVTALPIPGLYHVVLSGTFTSCHPNHGCGGGDFTVQGDISCC